MYLGEGLILISIALYIGLLVLLAYVQKKKGYVTDNLFVLSIGIWAGSYLPFFFIKVEMHFVEYFDIRFESSYLKELVLFQMPYAFYAILVAYLTNRVKVSQNE